MFSYVLHLLDIDLELFLVYTYYVIYVNKRGIIMSIPEEIKKQRPTQFGAVEIRTVACALILGILTNLMLSGEKDE